MKKTFKLQDLECAHCAAEMEEAGRKVDGVIDLSINFMTQKMKLEADDARFDEVLEAVNEVIKKVEPECSIVR